MKRVEKEATDPNYRRAKASIAREKRAMSRGGLSRVDWNLLNKRAARLLSPRQAESLAFHLMELDGACAVFRVKIRRLYRALAGATRDSANLCDTDCDLWTELLHLRYHVRGALPSSEKLIYSGIEPGSRPKRPKRNGTESRKKTKKKVTRTSVRKKKTLARKP